ncbi:MAG TPA: copper amine oxidase N-terminal domain-containing protein [Symbiobacteriaceae bacterium]|nr:copper amine oxidase N-terminal domain-containing protein [Symbiobacteriaceae bacterium]
MRKSMVGLIAAAALLIGVVAGAGAESIRKSIEVEYPGIQVRVDGKAVDSGASQPFIVLAEGRTYVPARALAEALGGKVAWDDASKSVLVYTSRYVEAATAGETTTYRMPYQGASIRLPSAWNRKNDDDNLLAVTGPGSMVIVNWGQMPDGVPFQTMVAATVEGFRNAAEFEVTSQKSIAPIKGAFAAQELMGTMGAGQVSVPYRMRLFAEGTNFWMVMVTYDAASDEGGVKAGQIMDGFALGQ